MDLPVRKKLPHTIPQWVSEGSWFFITINCEPRGKNHLCQTDGSSIAVNPLTADGAHGVTRPTNPEHAGPAIPCQPKQGWAGSPLPAGTGHQVLAAIAHNHDKLVWHCRLCLLMPDHLHAIMAFSREPGMKTLISNWKKFVATKSGVKWQRDFFDHRLRDNNELQEKTSYILMNPVRKGLCQRAEDWIWIYRPADRPPPILG
jgi:putative transposase